MKPNYEEEFYKAQNQITALKSEITEKKKQITSLEMEVEYWKKGRKDKHPDIYLGLAIGLFIYMVIDLLM